MAERRWKRLERETARILGTERLPNSGRGQPDLIAGRYGIEHKTRDRLPRWLVEAVAQAERNAPAGTAPVVVLTMPRGRGRKPLRLVVLRFEGFLDLVGGPGDAQRG